LLKRIVTRFSQSIISQSLNISTNDQHLFANNMQLKAQLLSSNLPHKLKFAQIAQIQVANLNGRLLLLCCTTTDWEIFM